MSKKIKIDFKDFLITLAINDVATIRTNTARVKRGHKYKQILSSIQAIGIIEPPVVTWNEKINKYILLDGHLRFEALKEIGIENVDCIISTDDESYTYNKYINKLSPIQAYNMINNALKNGVSEEKLAKALDLDMVSLRAKKNLLNNVSHEVVDLLKDKDISEKLFRLLRKMNLKRQLVAAHMMIDNNRYTYDFLKTIYDMSSDDDLIIKRVKKNISTEVLERRMRLEEENMSLSGDIQLLQYDYGINMLKFSTVHAFLRNVMKNSNVANFIKKFDEEIFNHFTKIISIDSITLSSLE
jgi:hypothetical protein